MLREGAAAGDEGLQRAWKDLRSSVDSMELPLNAPTTEGARDVNFRRQLSGRVMDGNGFVAWEGTAPAKAFRVDENPDLPQGPV